MGPAGRDADRGGPTARRAGASRAPLAARARLLWWEIRWPLVAGMALVTFALGLRGFELGLAVTGQARSLLDHAYLSLQLFTLESGAAVLQPVPWQLDVARFLAPALALYAAIQALLALFKEQAQMLRSRLFWGHVVVCGLGQRGLRFARGFRKAGFQVVVIEEDEQNPLIRECRADGIVVLEADVRDREVLRLARAHRAKYLVAACGDDGLNAAVASDALGMTDRRHRDVLTVFVHISDPELCAMLKEGEVSSAGDTSTMLEFFNVAEAGARMMLSESGVLDAARTFGRPPHLVVVGLGTMGRSLVRCAARTWWLERSARPARAARLKMTLVDRAVERKHRLLERRYTRLGEACEFRTLPIDIEGPEFEAADFLVAGDGWPDADAVFVCLDDDVRATMAALVLRRRIRGTDVPIVVRMAREAGLTALLKRATPEGAAEQLRPLGMLDRTCTLEQLLGGTHETLAQVIHEGYVRARRAAGDDPATNPSMAPWDELPEDLKESNRRQAAHIGVKLAAIGWTVEPLTDWSVEPLGFSDDEVEELARMEHDRWMKDRRSAGWRHAPGDKDLARKTSPHLVGWTELTEEFREVDREAVRAISGQLALAGLRAAPKGVAPKGVGSKGPGAEGPVSASSHGGGASPQDGIRG